MPPLEESGFRPIFDGQSLKGWDGDPNFWKVANGVMTGETTADHQPPYNIFCIWRDGKPMQLTATIGNAATLASADDASANSSQAKLGLALRPLNPEERQQAGVSGGLIVEDVQGRAAEAGIQPGDVVLSVDGTAVQTVAQLRQMVKDHDKQIALLIQRGDARLFVPVTLG